MAFESGEYWEEVVDTYGCAGTSESQFVQIVTGLDETMFDGITIFQNPSDDRFEIAYQNTNEKTCFRLYNKLAQQIIPDNYFKENKNLTIDIKKQL